MAKGEKEMKISDTDMMDWIEAGNTIGPAGRVEGECFRAFSYKLRNYFYDCTARGSIAKAILAERKEKKK